MNLNLKNRTARSLGLRVLIACCRITLHGFSVSAIVHDSLKSLGKKKNKRLGDSGGAVCV